MQDIPPPINEPNKLDKGSDETETIPNEIEIEMPKQDINHTDEIIIGMQNKVQPFLLK